MGKERTMKDQTMKDQTKSGPDMSKINPETVMAYGDNFIFRVDDQSRDHLILEVEDSDSGSSTVRIPLSVWQAIHQCGTKNLTLINVSDAHLRHMSKTMVNTRKAIRQSADEMPDWKLTHLGGFEAYGSEDEPEAVQIQLGFDTLKHLRAWEQAVNEQAAQYRVLRSVSSVTLPSFTVQ
jgi:hypothetical protein